MTEEKKPRRYTKHPLPTTPPGVTRYTQNPTCTRCQGRGWVRKGHNVGPHGDAWRRCLCVTPRP